MEIILSDHFKLSEFLYSQTALSHKCPEQFSPDMDIVYNLHALVVNVLEPVRVHLGKPIRVTSGYRCPALNRLVGGVDTSQHLKGMAADISCEDNQKLLYTITRLRHDELLDFDQLIMYGSTIKPRFIHISFNSLNNRQQLLYKL